MLLIIKVIRIFYLIIYNRIYYEHLWNVFNVAGSGSSTACDYIILYLKIIHEVGTWVA